MTPQEAIEAAELAEAETRYRLQFAREIRDASAAAEFSRGFEEGYMRAVADVKAAQQGIVRDARLEEVRWDLAAASTSPIHGLATTPAGCQRSASLNPNLN